MERLVLKNTGMAFGFLGISSMITSLFYPLSLSGYWLISSFCLMGMGILLYSYGQYRDSSPGNKNNGVWTQSLTTRGIWGWVLGMVLTAFYVALYWYPESLGYYPGQNSGLVALFDPLSIVLNGKAATEWFIYGTLYTFAIIAFGIKFI